MASNSYFSHDSNARNSKKMLRMRERLGELAPAAYGVYWMLVERLREEDGYECEKDYNMLAFDFRVDKELIRSVVEDFGLFDISDDGRTFSSHGLQERMDEAAEKHAAKSAAGKKGAKSRWGDKNTAEMAQNGTSMAEPQNSGGNKIKEIKEIKENYFFSLSPSPGEGAEEEKEKIVSFFTFQKNWASPCAEYDKLVAYNNRPGAKKKWAKMSPEEKFSVISFWNQEPPKPARYDQPFLEMWQQVYRILIDGGAPLPVRMAALDDTVGWKCDGRELTLTIPDLLREWMEERIDSFRPTIWRFVKQQGCNKMIYKTLNKTNQN